MSQQIRENGRTSATFQNRGYFIFFARKVRSLVVDNVDNDDDGDDDDDDIDRQLQQRQQRQRQRQQRRRR